MHDHSHCLSFSRLVVSVINTTSVSHYFLYNLVLQKVEEAALVLLHTHLLSERFKPYVFFYG